MASIEEAARAQRATPQEYLEGLHADFSSRAASLEQEANELENRMLFLRAEATSLRHAVAGVREALDVFHREMNSAKETINDRDATDQPAKEAPRRGGYPDGY